MRLKSRTWCIALSALCVSALLLANTRQANAEESATAKKKSAAAFTESQARAREILMRMARFLGAAPRFSVDLRAGYDAVQKSGEKIEFGETRLVTVARPDRLRVEGEGSDGTQTLTVFTGKEIVVSDRGNNVYATLAQTGGLDETIVLFVRDLGMRMPLAALLVSRLPAEMEARVRSIEYIEKTSINGTLSHHLAARTDTVDFQVWVADGDQPLPLRVVLTYKKAPGQPQFRATLSNWNLAPSITDSTFAATIPDGAQKIMFAAALPRVVSTARRPSAAKGAK